MAEFLNGGHIVADEQNRAPAFGNALHSAQTFPLEVRVAHCQHFVDYQDLGIQMSRHGKGQPHIHAARITLDRRVQKLLRFGERNNLIEFPPDFVLAHPQDGAVEIDVLTARQFGMETGPRLPGGSRYVHGSRRVLRWAR